MGFFDSVLKAVNKAVDFVGDIQDKANEAYSNKPAEEKAAAPKPAATTAPTATPPAMAYVADTITMKSPEGIPSRKCTYTFFNGDDKADYEIEASVSIDNRFHEYNSGAAEFDVTYIYAPDYKENSDDILDWESGTPYIFVGHDQMASNIHMAYNRKQPLPPKTSIQMVEGNNKFICKTTHSKFNEKYVLYHFKRGIERKMPYHMGAAIPENLVGTPLEQIVLDAADLMASTYLETIVKETPVVK